MMARYINRRGESIEVSDSHVETAIELKLELQKESASGRTSWSRHKRMMAEEGFGDSDSNESYRQMVKQEQKKRDLLPEAPKYADMVSDKKLNSVRDAIGEMYIAKRGAQNANRELNKVKRKMTDEMWIYEDVKEHISSLDLSELKPEELNRLPETKNSILVSISDWHVGLETDTFNYEVAKKRTMQYAEEIVKYSKMFNVSTVNVQNLGDTIEGTYMRNTQAFEVEFDYSTQVVKATELIYKFLNTLSEHLNVVYLGGIFGNHARITSNKFNNLVGDSSENIIDVNLESFIGMAENPRLRYDDMKQSKLALSFEINGKSVKSVHGDSIPKNGDRISKFISSDGVDYDILMHGHYHNYSVTEQNNDKLEISSGCLQGTTDYSKQLGYNTKPSQVIVVFEGDSVLPIRIPLD